MNNLSVYSPLRGCIFADKARNIRFMQVKLAEGQKLNYLSFRDFYRDLGMVNNTKYLLNIDVSKLLLL